MPDYYRPDNPYRPVAEGDEVAAVLAEVWGDNRREVEQGHRRYPEHITRLLATLEAIRRLPDDWDDVAADMMGSARGYLQCASELREAISRELLGER